MNVYLNRSDYVCSEPASDGSFFTQVLGTLSFMSSEGNIWNFPTLENMDTLFPSGTYELKLTYSKRFGRYLPLVCVPGRSGIRIHSGNYSWQSKGCVIVGKDIKYYDATKVYQLLFSRAALDSIITDLTPVFDSSLTTYLVVS